MKTLLIFQLLLLQVNAFCQTDTTRVNFVNPSSVFTPNGFSQVAKIDLGNCTMLILSGQVPLDKDGKLVGKDDLALQTEQVFINIKNCIESLGGTMDHLTRIGIFVTDISKIQSFRTVRDKYFKGRKPPVSTLAEVARLFREGILIEIEATAIIPK